MYSGKKDTADSPRCSVPEARSVRKDMAKQATNMMMEQWHRHRHVCENFSPFENATDCTGDRFYHWGALAGLVSLAEAGHY